MYVPHSLRQASHVSVNAYLFLSGTRQPSLAAYWLGDEVFAASSIFRTPIFPRETSQPPSNRILQLLLQGGWDEKEARRGTSHASAPERSLVWRANRPLVPPLTHPAVPLSPSCSVACLTKRYTTYSPAKSYVRMCIFSVVMREIAARKAPWTCPARYAIGI